MNRHDYRRGNAEPCRLPQPPLPGPAPSAFMLICPVVCLPGLTVEQMSLQHCIYRCAFEQAQAVVKPSLPERDLLAVWN